MAVDLQELTRRHDALLQERKSWEPDWRACARQFLPRKMRLLESGDQTNKGGQLNDLIDNTGVYAMRDLVSGLYSILSSPAQPWFLIGLQDEKMERSPGVRQWLDETQKRMRSIFMRSGFYNAARSLYYELGTFGTAFMFAVPDDTTGVRFTTLTAGEYALDTNEHGRVDTVFRTMDLTARQVVRMFGHDKCPDNVKRENDSPSTPLQRFKVVHAVYPRDDRSPGKMDGKNKRFASVYWLEPSGSSSNVRTGSGGAHLLSEGGFDQLPGFGPRWDVTGNDIYGTSLAMQTRPACQMVQQMKITALKAAHKEADPPMVGPGSLKNIDILPGGQNFADNVGTGQSVYPAMSIRPQLQNSLLFIQAEQGQVREGLLNNVLKMASDSDRRQMTAREAAIRDAEKQMLVSQLERLSDEFFIPLIDLTFSLMAQQDLLPPWPQEIAGMPIRVELVSLLSQAQKMGATARVDQFVAFIGQGAQIWPDLLDTVKPDEMANDYADYLGIEADELRSQDERDVLRQGRAKAAQAQQQQVMLEQAQAAAGTAKTLSEADMGQGQDGESRNALQSLLAGLGSAMGQQQTGAQ